MNSTMILFFVFVAIVVAWIIFYNLRGKRIEAEEEERKARLSEEEKIKEEEAKKAKEESSECCGQHETCEKDSLLAAVSKEVEYYNDEELDRFRGRASDEYTDEEVEEFREVMLTCKDDEVAGWCRSLQLRFIELPDELKDELFLIIGEKRTIH